VAVICPYQKQRAAVQARLNREPDLARVAQVRTIDQVQGREYETVIFTLVRSDGSPGFMASPNRMNVALSRAQRQLIVIGNARSFLDSDRVRARAPHLQFVIERMLPLEQEL
jgi:superfamily I DNA and/or RNA helicase